MNNTPIDAIILGGIDQFLPQRQAEKEFLARVDEQVRKAISSKDIRSLEDIGVSLLGIGQVTGIAFSQYSYTVEACWKEIGRQEDFYHWAEDKFARDARTIERHQRIWAMFVSGDVPKEYVEKFKTMPIRVLIPIASLWNQGYEITDLQWKHLSSAPDPSTVRKIIQQIKGKPSREGTLQMEWNREQKSITGWVNNFPHTIRLMYEESDEVIEKMLARLFGDGRVLEK